MKTRQPLTEIESGSRHAAQLFEASIVKFTKLRRPRALLAIVFAVAILPATGFVYLQYRSLSDVQERMQQTLFVNLRQAVIGARVEARQNLVELSADFRDTKETALRLTRTFSIQKPYVLVSPAEIAKVEGRQG